MEQNPKDSTDAGDKAGPGRPTLYKSEYCEQLIEHMAGGLSYESFAAVIDVNRDTLYEWEKVHPEFSDAKKTARDKGLLYWERLGRDHVLNETIEKENVSEGTYSKSSKALNPSVWIFNMKNRFGWRDKQPGEADVVVNNLTTLSDEELERKALEIAEKLTSSDTE